MISFFITIVIALFLIIVFFIRIIVGQVSKKWDYVLCIVLPLLCLSFFIAIFIESSLRRRHEMRDLDKMREALSFAVYANCCFPDNEVKGRTLDTLRFYQSKIADIAYNDTLLYILCGNDAEMTSRIEKTRNAIDQQIKWIERLNDIYIPKAIYNQKKESSDKIYLIRTGVKDLNVTQLAFQYSQYVEDVVCTHVEVFRDDSLVYSQSFENRDMNCYAIPHVPNSKEYVDIGFIADHDNQLEFNYIRYGRQ